MRRWVPPAVVGALIVWTALATPLSVSIGEYLAYDDPQSDPERLAYHRDVAAHVYTAGHWLGQLVAAMAGTLFAGSPGAYRRAATAGAVLGLVTGTVAILAGTGAMRESGHPSVAPDPTMLSDSAVRWCLAASLACFPLWALIGAATARVVRRGPLRAVAAVFLLQPATLALVVGVAAPPSSHPPATALIADAGSKALLLPAILLAWAAVAVAAAAVVHRRRRSAGD